MKEKNIDVRTGGKVVATLVVPQYETLEEVLESVLPDTIVSFVNRTLATDASNLERAKHRPSSAGKQKRRTLAIQCAFESSDYKDQLLELLQGEPAALEEFLDSTELQELVTAKITAAVPVAGDEE